MPSVSAQTQSTEFETPDALSKTVDRLNENIVEKSNDKKTLPDDDPKVDTSEMNASPTDEQDSDVAQHAIEEAEKFNQELLTALQDSKAFDNTERLNAFIEHAPDLVKHPVSFNMVVNFLLDEKLYLHKIIGIYKGANKLSSVNKVYIPSGDDHAGFMSILNKMIDYDDKDYSKWFMQFLMGDGRDKGFFVSTGPVNLEEAESFNEAMLTILEKDKSYLKKVNAYCLTFSKRLKVHEDSYIPLLCKISEMEGK